MKNLILILFLPLGLLAQDSWVRFQVQFDFYAPTESNFFMVSDASGDTSMFYQPTIQYEYLDTIINVFSGDYTISLNDSYGDGWTSTNPASFRMGNACQGPILHWDPVVGSFFQRDSTVTILPCPPPGPPPVCVQTVVLINLDQYPEETSWDIKDSLGNVLLSGGVYSNVPDYQPQVIINCLPVGELSFTIYDLYGDGLEGSLWGGQDGSYYVIQCGDTLVYGDDPSFGQDSTHVFISDTCVPPPPVLGCMDDDYVEYDPSATVSDSSCATLKIYGCTDDTMFNYNPIANTMENIDQCSYDLILHDLVGNGWVGTRLEIYQDGDTSIFNMTGGFNQAFTLDLYAPAQVGAKLFVSQQAQSTSIECGFTLIGPEGDTAISISPPFIVPFVLYEGFTYCGNICEEKIYGCMDSTAYNYSDTANTADFCYWFPGCASPAYVEYHNDTTNGYTTDFNVIDSCFNLATFGCMDSTAYNYDSTANVDNGGCLAYIYGCMDGTMFNYNPLATAPDTCIPFLYGCTDPTMFNYDQLANSDNGSCTPFVYGCTDSTAFNYNPLANADNNSCVPFIYGCTDPSALNYSPQANTEDFSCVAYIYGCMDSLALNYDSLANTDNGSCISIIVGCMDQTAYNYNGNANVDDPLSCLYSAGCATGDSIPYWLNDPCYAWVIDIDEYCCENEWDTICQATYSYCEGTWSGPLLTRGQAEKKLVAVTDLLGRETKIIKNKLLLFIYSDGSVIKQLIKK